jgi:RNA polymerase sigma factor (sigma-70 family)
MTERDKIVIQAIRDGKDDAALSVLYKEVLPKIKNMILKNNGTIEDVKDIFQDAIIIFYKQVKLGKYKEEHDIDGYIYTISRNLYINLVKRKKPHEKLESLHESEGSDANNSLDDLITKEKQKMIGDLMSRLGERCKELLTLSIFNKFSMKEIAEKMGFANENAAKTSNYKCKQKLMNMVKSNPSLIQIFKG